MLRLTSQRLKTIGFYGAFYKTRAELALKQWVRKEDWNPIKGFAKPKNEELSELNSYLETVRGKISSYYRSLDLDDAIISAEILKNKYIKICVYIRYIYMER